MKTESFYFSNLSFSDCNGIYLLGRFNGVEFSRITKLNTAELRDTTVYSIYVSQKDEIFLISSSGDVYKSTTDADIRFERIILFNQNDNIRKFCSGYDFVCVLTGEYECGMHDYSFIISTCSFYIYSYLYISYTHENARIACKNQFMR